MSAIRWHVADECRGFQVRRRAFRVDAGNRGCLVDPTYRIECLATGRVIANVFLADTGAGIISRWLDDPGDAPPDGFERTHLQYGLLGCFDTITGPFRIVARDSGAEVCRFDAGRRFDAAGTQPEAAGIDDNLMISVVDDECRVTPPNAGSRFPGGNAFRNPVDEE